MEIIKRRDGIKYREKIYIEGTEYKSPVFIRKTDAKAWKAEMMVKKLRGQSGNVPPDMNNLVYSGVQIQLPSHPSSTFHPPAESINFRKYAENWLEEKVKVRSTNSTYQNYRSNLLTHIFPLVGKISLQEITIDHADKLVKKLKDSGHNAKGVNLILGVFRRVLLEAVNQEKVMKNPFRHFRELRERKGEGTFLTRQEIQQFLQANVTDPLYPLFVVALNTGMRRGEMAGLCWDRVNFETNLIEVTRTRDRDGLGERTKTLTSRRHIPMNKQVRDVLLHLHLHLHSNRPRGVVHTSPSLGPSTTSPSFVFFDGRGRPIDVHHLYREFKEAQKRAKFTRFIRFHDIRHTFSSHFMMNGGNIYDLQKLLGHQTMDMTQRYAHLAPDHLAKAVDRVSFAALTPDDEDHFTKLEKRNAQGKVQDEIGWENQEEERVKVNFERTKTDEYGQQKTQIRPRLGHTHLSLLKN